MPKVVHNKAVEPDAPVQVAPTVNLRPDVEFSLPDGRKVKMGKPPVPTQALLPAIMGGMAATEDGRVQPDPLRSEFNARMCIFVRELDGRPTSIMQSAGDVMGLMRQLGEDGCDLVFDVYIKHFGPLTSNNLDLIKK